jgi:hypothetical protein
MKKLTTKQRSIDVRRSLNHRRKSHFPYLNQNGSSESVTQQLGVYTGESWFKRQLDQGLDLEVDLRGAVTINLPSAMNFSVDYESTAICVMTIRHLARKRPHRTQYHLGLVNFEQLTKISTSAALVLTAELSKWEDSLRQNLEPRIDNWNPDILFRFFKLGFFDLFEINPFLGASLEEGSDPVSIVKYIKGQTGDSVKTRLLKEQIGQIVGDDIKKWIFLNTGLSEAITNVTHHAYPEDSDWKFIKRDKVWYLTGAYNRDTKEIKVIFYDQGIGIPRSLPASEMWERVLNYLSTYPRIEKRRDATMLKAAVELSRTSSGQIDRGKGLQDLLEFVKQRGEGYLSIMSQRGLYKFSIAAGVESVKTEHFDNPLQGTLIIWRTVLREEEE